MKAHSDSDDDYYDWLTHYNDVAAANMAALGLSAPDVAAINSAWIALGYARAAEENTQAAWHASVVNKDQKRSEAEAITNGLTKGIQARPGVSDMLKSDLGITVPKTTRTPAAVPTTAPSFQRVDTSVGGILGLYIVDATTPDSRAKPPGVVSCEVRMQVGGTPPASRDAMVTAGIVTRSPFRKSFELEDVGKTVYFALRWLNTRSEPGPWSPLLTAVIPG